MFPQKKQLFRRSIKILEICLAVFIHVANYIVIMNKKIQFYEVGPIIKFSDGDA